MASHRTLKAWHHAKTLAVECTRAARLMPRDERDGLGSQLRRAACGAALNIAEGCSRRTDRDYRRFLDTARSSLDEVDAILEIIKELAYLDDATIVALQARRDEAAKTLYGLLRAVSARCTS